MNKCKERGVTLVALVITIVVLIIIASIGISSGQNSIKISKYKAFRNELRIIQEKVNVINEKDKLNIGNEITEEQKQILHKNEIAEIIFKNKSIEEKEEIIKKFRFCSKEYIENNFNINKISSDYLINAEKRIVINCKGHEYEGKKYYMLQQIKGEAYNVEYNNKNPATGTFEAIYEKEDNKWKIEITNINYEGYNENWEVKYKLEEEDNWKTSKELTFYVKETGAYQIKLVHGEEIELQMITKYIVEEREEI